MTPKQMARLGVFHIEEAILDILFQADGQYVRAIDISRDCGMSQSWDESHWIIAAILNKLEIDKRVEARRGEPKPGRKGRASGWKLTVHESNRRADISD